MNQKLVERVVAGLLLAIAAGMAVHTPVTLWLGTFVSDDWALVIKSWKEVLMGIALVLLFAAAVRRNQLTTLLMDRLLQLSLIYAGLHFVMMLVFQNGLAAAGAGLLIDLRFVLYFVLVYVFLTLYPGWRRAFIVAFGVGAVVVVGFAVLQMTILPKDFLAHIGYSKATIAPYLTVDDNPALIRINSMLRGPNPLGAYAVIVLGVLMAVVLRWKLHTRRSLVVGGLALGAVAALSASYSRSSLIAATVTLVIVLVASVGARARRKLLIGSTVALVVIATLTVIFRDSYIVSNVIFHDNPSTGATVDSNTGHAESIVDGFSRILRQPFGAGVGSTGSASLIGDNPLIIENQFLLVAHEVGWVGLVLFVWLFVEVLRRLWIRRQSALALGVFASGIGLAIIGLLLPVWTDDATSITWWGLAAVAIAQSVMTETTHKKARKKHDTRKSD